LLDDLRGHARSMLAGYKLPKQLVVVEQVERLPSGKADYRWAKARAGATSTVGSSTTI
jgi:acyl-CoA synthetase (AMP-forming)/AMP-acid ligase II